MQKLEGAAIQWNTASKAAALISMITGQIFVSFAAEVILYDELIWINLHVWSVKLIWVNSATLSKPMDEWLKQFTKKTSTTLMNCQIKSEKNIF